MLKMSIMDFQKNVESFIGFYKLEDITAVLSLWYNLWKKKNLTENRLNNIEVTDRLNETNVFSLPWGKYSQCWA